MSRYKGVMPGTFGEAIRLFRLSAKWQSLAPSTQANFGYAMREAEQVLGGLAKEIVGPPIIQAFLDRFAHVPGTQRNVQTAIKVLEKWAIVRGHLPHPISTGTEAPGAGGGYVPWTDEQVSLAETEASPAIRRAVTLAANTGQRASDLVKMRWSDIEEYGGRPGINVRQQKTGLVLWVPMTTELAAAITSWERRPTFLLLKADGLPFTRHQLSDQWLRERDTRSALAPLAQAGCVLHGLRATAVVRLRRAGCTTGEICSMVGMSEPMVNRYCRHSVQRDNALAAVYRLDGTRVEQKRDKESG